MRIFRGSLVACAALILAGSQANAATIGLDVKNGDVSGNLPASPYATLDITGNTTDGTVTFVLTATQPTSYAQAATVVGLGFNTTVSGITLTSVKNQDGDTLDYQLIQNGNLDGFGKFIYVIDSTSNNIRATELTMVIQLSDHSQAVASNFIGTNDKTADGYYFASHYNPADGGGTGFIATSTAGLNPVPEPSTIALGMTALGILGLSGLRHRQRRGGLARIIIPRDWAR